MLGLAISVAIICLPNFTSFIIKWFSAASSKPYVNSVRNLFSNYSGILILGSFIENMLLSYLRSKFNLGSDKVYLFFIWYFSFSKFKKGEETTFSSF